MLKKNKKKYLICSDLDGTLLTSSKEISNYSTKVIKEISKIAYFCLFTARPLRTSIEFYKKLNLNTILVNYNGALIHNPLDDNSAKVSFHIDKKNITKIFSDKNIVNLIEFAIFESNKGIYIFKNGYKIISPTKPINKKNKMLINMSK